MTIGLPWLLWSVGLRSCGSELGGFCHQFYIPIFSTAQIAAGRGDLAPGCPGLATQPSRPRCFNACGDRGRAGGIIPCLLFPRGPISDVCGVPQRESNAPYDGEGHIKDYVKLVSFALVMALGYRHDSGLTQRVQVTNE